MPERQPPTEPAREADRRIAHAIDTHAENLDLRGLSLTTVPASLRKATQIHTLTLANNRLRQFYLAKFVPFDMFDGFLASDYCYEVEMKKALERRAGGTIVIPIIVRPCEWQDADFSKLEALPRDARPVSTWADRDAAWSDVAAGIKKVLRSR